MYRLPRVIWHRQRESRRSLVSIRDNTDLHHRASQSASSMTLHSSATKGIRSRTMANRPSSSMSHHWTVDVRSSSALQLYQPTMTAAATCSSPKELLAPQSVWTTPSSPYSAVAQTTALPPVLLPPSEAPTQLRVPLAAAAQCT